jgi:hypothetical protein
MPRPPVIINTSLRAPLEIKDAPPGTIFVSDEPLAGETLMPTQREITPMDATCGGIFDPCGIVNNRTGDWLYLNRDSNATWSCDAAGPYRWLPDGWNSNSTSFNPVWPDTDCFTSDHCDILYAGFWYDPWEWVRIHNSVFVYNLSC